MALHLPVQGLSVLDVTASYFLVVGHTQFVGMLLPRQTLPWQNAILSVGFALPGVTFGFFIVDAFFL